MHNQWVCQICPGDVSVLPHELVLSIIVPPDLLA